MLLVGNGKVITRDEALPYLEDGAVLLDGEAVREVGPLAELKAKYPGAEFVDARGGVIMPGLINVHTHIYSGLARGLSIDGFNPTNFFEVLDGQWWYIDRHLTLDGTRASAYATVLDCIRDGVTTIFDHHASFCEIPGSLFASQDVCRELGIRANLCYEVSERDGEEKCRQAIRENADFARWAKEQDDDMIKAMFGGHAMFTISDKTFEEMVKANDGMTDRLPEEGAGKFIFSVTQPDKLSALWSAFGYEPAGALAHHINFAVLEEEHCRLAFFRGAFLAGGSVTDPAKRYHLELSTPHLSVSRELRSLLLEAGFTPKETTRKGNSVTYFKQSEAIEDFLTAIGAPLAAMEIMNAKAEKDLRGSVNRRVNCDAANLDKAVDAAQVQLEAIATLEERGLLEELPDKLKEAVDLRVAHPEFTLTQLAELCNPPVSKSAFNHRLRKLVELSKR